eukprot:2742636-Prymnesium_polylepis.1
MAREECTAVNHCRPCRPSPLAFSHAKRSYEYQVPQKSCNRHVTVRTVFAREDALERFLTRRDCAHPDVTQTTRWHVDNSLSYGLLLLRSSKGSPHALSSTSAKPRPPSPLRFHCEREIKTNAARVAAGHHRDRTAPATCGGAPAAHGSAPIHVRAGRARARARHLQARFPRRHRCLRAAHRRR